MSVLIAILSLVLLAALALILVMYIEVCRTRRVRDRYEDDYRTAASITQDWSTQRVRWEREVDKYHKQYSDAQRELDALRQGIRDLLGDDGQEEGNS
jgi:predicted  nucleic acid-binding Zn-ribbon protein